MRNSGTYPSNNLCLWVLYLRVERLKDDSLRLLALPANIRLGWKGLPGTNTLYYGSNKFYSTGWRRKKILIGSNLIEFHENDGAEDEDDGGDQEEDGVEVDVPLVLVRTTLHQRKRRT